MNDSFKTLDALAGLDVGIQRVLENATFENATLERLLIGPGMPPQSTVRVRNSLFSSCSVRGEFRVAPGVELDSVVFDNVSSPDSMTINTQTILNNVVVRGAPKTGGLWVKPADFVDADLAQRYGSWASKASESIDCMLDFSDLESLEVEVIGLPLSKLLWNRDRHVQVRREWRESEEWKQINFPLTSFWSLRLKRLQSFSATEGIFALPSPKDKKYAQTKEEMHRLCQVGLLRLT